MSKQKHKMSKAEVDEHHQLLDKNEESVEEQRESKGLWKLMQEQAKVVYWPPDPPMTIEDIRETFQNLWKEDIARRERMDKEYTDISKIKLSELDEIMEKYNGDVPNGLLVKVKMAGQYMDIPIKSLYQYLKAVEEYVKENYKPEERDK